MKSHYEQQKFFYLIQKSKINEFGCIEWLGGKDKNGYGHTIFTPIKSNRKTWKTHRLMWYLINGEIPKGMIICHKCDNPSCINLNHLFLGTHKENSKDRDKKNRGYFHKIDQNGEKNRHAFLTEKNVYEIRELLKQNHTQSYIAKIFNVSQTTISKLKLKKRWQHLCKD